MSTPELVHRVAGPVASSLAAIFHRLPPGPPRVTVLTYHRVAPRRGDDPLLPGMISATPDEFERHIDLVASRVRVLSIDDLLEHVDGRRLRDHAAMFTFDDAYRDVADHAWPILRRRSLPATMFVPTGYIDRPDRPLWWDRLHHALTTTERSDLRLGGRHVALGTDAERRSAWTMLRADIKAQPHDQAMATVDALCDYLGPKPPVSGVLGWAELAELERDGLAMAPHSVDHPLLTRVSSERARAEIAGSLRDLRAQIGVGRPVFAYPSGAVDARVAEIARAEGMRVAFTTVRGSIRPHRDDPMQFRRVNVGPRTTAAVLDAEIAVLGRIGRIPRT